MKGFIEVTNRENEKLELINVRWIEKVRGNTIYIAFSPISAMYQDYITCAESYEQIGERIAEAME